MWEFYDDLVKLWGGSPATELLTCGISSKDINLPSCSSTSTSSSFSDGTNESDEDNNDKNIELTSSFKKPRKSSNPISQHLNNKHKHLEWQLREHSHITYLLSPRFLIPSHLCNQISSLSNPTSYYYVNIVWNPPSPNKMYYCSFPETRFFRQFKKIQNENDFDKQHLV